MTSSPASLTTGSVISLASSPKKSWGQGDVRVIASGSMQPEGTLEATGAGATDFDWRLSVASIEGAGDFTPYPDFERTLTVIVGELLELTIDGETHPVELYRPLKFAGGAATVATLPTGDVLALNVFARTGVARASVRIVELSKKMEQHLFGAQFGVLLQGAATMSYAGTDHRLEVRDTVVGGEDDSPRITGRGFMAVVSFDLP